MVELRFMSEAAVPGDPAAVPGRPHPPLDRRRLTLLLAPIAGFVIATQVGVALGPSLVDRHPLVLLALAPMNRHLALVAGQIDVVPLFVVGTLRLMAPDLFFYLLGFFYGERALSWMEERTASVGRLMRKLEALFRKAGHVLVFVMPNNYVSLIAGASGMPTRVFWPINFAGTVARIALFRAFGLTFEKQVDSVLEFIKAYRPWILAVTIGLVVFTAVRELRTGTSELQSLAELEEELEAVEDEHRAMIDRHLHRDGEE